MIAITGAAGFIGSNLAHRHAGRGHRLLLVDHLPGPGQVGHWEGLGRFEFATPGRFIDLLRREDPPLSAIFHLGACSRTTETDWSVLRRDNIDYPRALWRWCADRACPFYYASSAATYGDGSVGFDDRRAPALLAPLNAYGRSKNEFDRWALEQVDRGAPAPPSWAGLKFFNVYGPRESHKGAMASVVWHAHRQILESGEARLFRSNDPAIADGDQRRDFVFVEDCLDHLDWLHEHPVVSGLFNSGSGVARTFGDLARAVFGALGLTPRIRYVPMPDHLARQYQNYTQADMGRLRDLGFDRPATPLEEGVRRCIASMPR